MLLFNIIFGDRNPRYPALGFNIPSARRTQQRFQFLQCRGSSPSLRFVNRHWGTLRRAGWVAFTKTYSRGKWLILHLPPTFSITIHIPPPLHPCFWRPRVPVPHVPMSHSWCPQVPRLASPIPQVPTHAYRCPRPLVPVQLLYTAPWKVSSKASIASSSEVKNKNDAIRNRISNFDKWRISLPKIQ